MINFERYFFIFCFKKKIIIINEKIFFTYTLTLKIKNK
jgi:hypothetical protein